VKIKKPKEEKEVVDQHLSPEQLAIQKLQDAVHTYADRFHAPLTGTGSKYAEDAVVDMEIIKMNFRNQLIAIETELTTDLINRVLGDNKISQLKKENLPKGV
jgi:hypothetical protein